MKLDIQIEITEDFSKLEKKHGKKDLGGATEYLDFKGKCKLYIPNPRDVFDFKAMCIAGHELFHCIYGDYHDKNHGKSC